MQLKIANCDFIQASSGVFCSTGSGIASEGSGCPLPVRFIVSDASSYLYLNDFRPAPECLENTAQVVSHHRNGEERSGETWSQMEKDKYTSCVAFKSLSEEQVADCPDIDKWKYGVHIDPAHLETGKGHSYFLKLRDARTLIELNDKWPQKDVRYVFGARDTCNCFREEEEEEEEVSPRSKKKHRVNEVYCFVSCAPAAHSSSPPDLDYCSVATSFDEVDSFSEQFFCHDTFPDSLNNDLSVTCAADVQGSNRLQRGLLYMSYLQWLYGDEYRPVFEVVIGLQHDVISFFQSDLLREWAFEASSPLQAVPDPAADAIVRSGVSNYAWGGGTSEGSVFAVVVVVCMYSAMVWRRRVVTSHKKSYVLSERSLLLSQQDDSTAT